MGDSFSTAEGSQYIGDTFSTCGGIASVLRRVVSTLGIPSVHAGG